MAKTKTVYEIKIDAEIGDLKRSLDQAKTALSSLGGSSFATGLDKKITNILSAIDKLQKKAGQPIDSKSTFSSLEKGFSSVIFDAKSLLSELDKISTLTTKEKISLLPEDEAKKLKEAVSAVQAYDRALEKLEKRRIKDLESAKASKIETEGKLKTAKSDVRTAKSAYKAATEKGSEYGDAAAIIAQAEAAKKAKKELAQLEKQLKDYRKELEELKKIENRTPEQESRMATVRSNISSVSGKMGARTRAINAGPDEKTLTVAQKTVDEQGPEIDRLAKSVSTAEKEVVRLEKALEGLKEKISENSEEIVSSQADYKILYDRAQKLGISLKGVTSKATPENVATLKERFSELVESGIEPVTAATRAMTPEIQKAGEVAQDTADKVQAASHNYDALANDNARIDNLKSTIAQFVGWTGATKALSAALRNAFEATKELDKAMTEIAVVTDFEVGDMWDQLPEYTQRANELGISITSAYEASALFYQQGLDTNEMVELSSETLKMARIAGLDAAEATDRMTAALRGFNMELDQASAQKVADVYSELAAITASDVDEISKAMTKTASIASSAGMEFETTAAFLSQIIETTRESAETAGTAMKTVIARFQELKKAPEDIGEVDGEIVDANQIETALRSVGVSLRDASGQFRELDEVFLELSSKWNTLDKNTQRYIATIAAGSRQQSRFIAMMQDYERTQELVTAANNSAGASQRQYEKTLDSLETKLARLENAWSEFSTGLMNSDLVKFAVDFLTNILSVLNSVTKGFESFTGSFSKIGTLIAIFQTAKIIVTKFFDGLIENIYSSAKKTGEKISQGVNEGIQKEESKQKSEGLGHLVGFSQAKAGAKQIAEARGLKVDKTGKEVEAWRRKYNDALVKKNKLEEEGLSNTEEYTKAVKDLNEINEQRVYTSAEAAKIEKEGFKQIASGAQTAAQAVTMLGVGIGVVGQIFINMGMEEVGENFQMVGNAVTFLGSALMALVPIVNLLGTTFTVAGTEISAAGIIAQIGWWPLLLITLAIVAVIGTVIAVANAIKKASPEYKLEQAQEAADKAADAADRASDAYENLIDQFEGLEEGYKALENLTRGTEEWNKAIREINSSVLDLIQQYPELAKFVNNKNGVLTIDLDDASVQSVLKEAEASAVIASNSVMMANLNVARAEDELAYKHLDDKAKFGLIGANLAYGAALTGSVTAGAGAGAGIGAGIGAIAGKVAGGIAGGVAGAGVGAAPGAAAGGIGGTALGAIIGGVVGGVGGLIGGFAAADAAKDAALEDTQKTTEALAKAIADGAIIDNGFGYEVMDAEKLAKYGLDANKLKEYHMEVGDSTEALRSFGDTLLETERQEEAAFGALAASAYSLANVLGMTQEEREQAGNVVDDVTIKRMYDEEMAKLGDQDYTIEEGSNAMDEAEKNARDAAIKAQYGADARIEGDTVYFRKDGEQQTEKLTSDEIKGLIVNQKVTGMATDAVEMAPGLVDKIVRETGLSGLEKATMGQGGNLTKAEAEELASDNSIEKLKSVWDSLSVNERAVFGTYDDYIAKTQGVAKTAEGAFEKAQKTAEKIFGEGNDLIKDFMTSDMAKGFSDKMEQIYRISGEEGAKEVKLAYETLIQGQDDATAQRITALINGVDWTNQEQLLSLQIRLQEQFNYTEEEAKDFCDTLGDTANAVSSLTTTVEIFGDFYQATQKINKSMKKLTDLQWEYDRMLAEGADAVEYANNIEEQKLQVVSQGNAALEAYNAAREDQAKIYASGVSLPNVGKDLTKYINFDPTSGQYDVSALQAQINAGEFGAEGSESRKAVEDYVNKLVEANKTAEDQLDIARDSYKQLQELNEQAEEAYRSLWEQIEDLLLSEMEKDISVQEEILDATKTANEKIVDKLEEQIAEQRQQRENEKIEQEIDDMQKRAAYLSMDTSGANALELLELDKQIADQEQEYQDSLVDQALQSLQDANEHAAEQREEQISLQRAQLELFKNSQDFQNRIQSTMDGYLEEYYAYEQEYSNWQKQEDAKTLSISEFAKKYPEHMENTATIMEEWKNKTLEKPTFSAEDTELGRLMVASGVLDGLNSLEERDFWRNLEYNTALSAKYADGTLEHGTEMDDLLSAIRNNTSVDNLTEFFYAQEFMSAVKGAEQAGYAIPNVDTSKYYETTTLADGSTVTKFNTQRAMSDLNKITSANEYAGQENANGDTLKDTNTIGTNFLNTYSGYFKNGTPYTEKEYYDKLKAGETVTVANGVSSGVDYTMDAETLVNNLAGLDSEGNPLPGGASTYGSYESYAKAFVQANSSSIKSDVLKELSTLIVKETTGDFFAKYGGAFRGVGSVSKMNGYGDLYNKYMGAGGTDKNWKQQISTQVSAIGTGAPHNVPCKVSYQNGGSGPDYLYGSAEIGGTNYQFKASLSNGNAKGSEYFKEIVGKNPQDGWMVMKAGGLYVYDDYGYWGKIENSDLVNAYKKLLLDEQRTYFSYKTGGLADFTGPAWLDGTPSKPEYILNAAQTERFFSLIDVLEGYDTNNKKVSSGDNYFEIEINVEKIEEDYDVEQIANKIRSMIYEDATYRNVNAINQIH